MKTKRKKNRTIMVFIKATFNNTLVTIADEYGNSLGWLSGGVCGFKGARKSSPVAASKVGLETLKKCLYTRMHIVISGPGTGKENILNLFQEHQRKFKKFKILSIRNRTTFPHNGCRPPKRRRV